MAGPLIRRGAIQMKNFFDSKWFYRVVALFFAIMLFSYVNADKLARTGQNLSNNRNSSSLTSNKKVTLTVPLELNVNSNKYFVTGYPQNVKLTIEGPAALVTATANTQNFKVYADLSKLAVGKHAVKIQVAGLNKELSYTLSQKYIHINLAQRRTATYQVEASFDKANVADGYTAGSAELGSNSVKATGSIDEVSRIAKVLAVVNTAKNLTKDVNQQAMLEAVDSSGKTVNVVLTPSTTSVVIPIKADTSTKKVDVDLRQSGKAEDNTKYSFSTDTKSVTLTGSKSALAKIKSLPVEVDVSGVTKDTSKEVTVTSPGDGVTAVSPTKLTVKINVQSN